MGNKQRQPPDGYATWQAYWTTHDMPWRTEPDIGEERQRLLTERRSVKPDIEKGIYPFRDETGPVKLTRADVEWLLVTHESDGRFGPLAHNDQNLTGNWEGIDLRGADLVDEDLSSLPLAGMRGGLFSTILAVIPVIPFRRRGEVDSAAALAGVNLSGANLACADLRFAQLNWAVLIGAHLERANLSGAMLAGANLRRAVFSEETDLTLTRLTEHRLLSTNPYDYFHSGLRSALMYALGGLALLFVVYLLGRRRLMERQRVGPALALVRWHGADLTAIRWEQVTFLRDEWDARNSVTKEGRKRSHTSRAWGFGNAALVYETLSTYLRGQGVTQAADRFAYRAQLCRRRVACLEWRWLRYFGSLFLGLVSGYGYRPLRSVVTYLLMIALFALAYWALGVQTGHLLTWNEAAVVSLTAFHGRGFFATAFQPSDPQAVVAAIEAVIGLLIEITFIATFTQRFFAR